MIPNGYFQHLLYEGYNGSIKKLMDMNIVHSFLDKTPGIMGMTKICLPNVHRYDSNDGMWGVTGLVVISESHLSIHTWPEIGYAAIDLFSCKYFDVELCKNHIKSFFEFNESKEKIIRRGFTEEEYNLLKMECGDSSIKKPENWMNFSLVNA